MIDRYRSNLSRTRRYADPFGDEGAASDRDVYVRWLGLRCKERTLFVVGLTLAGIMVALLVAKSLLDGRVSWLPTGVLWFEIGFLTCIVLMSITACSMFICGSIAVRRQIRDMNAQIARWDDATPEEVEAIVRESDRRLNRRVFGAPCFGWLPCWRCSRFSGPRCCSLGEARRPSSRVWSPSWPPAPSGVGGAAGFCRLQSDG